MVLCYLHLTYMSVFTDGLAKIRVAPINNTRLQVCHKAKYSYRVVINISYGRIWHQEGVLKIS